MIVIRILIYFDSTFYTSFIEILVIATLRKPVAEVSVITEVSGNSSDSTDYHSVDDCTISPSGYTVLKDAESIQLRFGSRHSIPIVSLSGNRDLVCDPQRHILYTWVIYPQFRTNSTVSEYKSIWAWTLAKCLPQSFRLEDRPYMCVVCPTGCVILVGMCVCV